MVMIVLHHVERGFFSFPINNSRHKSTNGASGYSASCPMVHRARGQGLGANRELVFAGCLAILGCFIAGVSARIPTGCRIGWEVGDRNEAFQKWGAQEVAEGPIQAHSEIQHFLKSELNCDFPLCGNPPHCLREAIAILLHQELAHDRCRPALAGMTMNQYRRVVLLQFLQNQYTQENLWPVAASVNE